MHRPSNVDDLVRLKKIFDDILSLPEKIVYPIHHRTKRNLRKIGYLDLIDKSKNMILIPAQGYLEFTCLMANAAYVITDSGGIQEETTTLDIPCFTLRPNTERPCTLIHNQGTNQLIDNISDIKHVDCKSKMILWDGRASMRILEILKENL